MLLIAWIFVGVETYIGLAGVTTFVVIYRRGQMPQLPKRMKLSVVYYGYSLLMGTVSCVVLVTKQHFPLPLFAFNFLFFELIFKSTHWLFISQYLQVACLFKMTFMFHDESVLAQMKHRRKLLIILNVAMLLTVAAVNLGNFIWPFYNEF